MKKKRAAYIVLFLLFSICTETTCQEYSFDTQILYRMTYQPDSMNSAKIEQLDMELLINDSISVFQQIKNRQADSLLYYHHPIEVRYSSGRHGIALRPINPFNYLVWKRDDKLIYYDPLYGGPDYNGIEEHYHYEEDIADMAWILTDEVDSIGPYMCQKSELHYGGRDWVAWFSTDIPVADGPYKFAGLPGLIVRMHDTREHWSFDLISLRQVDISHVFWFKEWQKIVPASMDKLKKDRAALHDYLGKSIMELRSDDRFPEMTESQRREIQVDFQKRLAADNNSIEL